jgi:type III restriction enzyme
MPNPFFEHPNRNSPYVCPMRRWELDEQGQPTQQSPDFIVLVDDGHGDDDLLHLIVEIKGYRREDAKEKKSTMETYWVPGVNTLKTYGRWSFAEFTEMYGIEADFKAKVEAEFNKMIAGAAG